MSTSSPPETSIPQPQDTEQQQQIRDLHYNLKLLGRIRIFSPGQFLGRDHEVAQVLFMESYRYMRRAAVLFPSGDMMPH